MGFEYKRADRFKTSVQFINLPYRNLYAALDACKVADYALFVLSSSVEVDSWGDMLLRTLQAQGLPHVMACVAPNSEDPKTRTSIQKSLLSFMQYFVPSLSRIFDLSTPSDRANGLRAICEGKPSEVRWRNGRPWLLAETVVYQATENQESTEGPRRGQLHVTGVVRGAPLSADRLIHLPGYGDFQIERILSAALPRMTGRTANADMEIESEVLAEPDADGVDSLVSTNVPDDMMNEQTWPTEDEMNGGGTGGDHLPDAKLGTTPKTVKRVPKGWSDYQAAWIVEDDDEDGVDGASEDWDDLSENGEAKMETLDDVQERDDAIVDGDGDEYRDIISTVNDKDEDFEDMDMEEENRQ